MSGDNVSVANADSLEDSIPFSNSNDQVQDKLLLEPYIYLLQAKGKSVRKKLLQAFNVWLKVPDERVVAIGSIIQMLHNASLLIDDIEDNSILRRGIPVAHNVYGEPSTINSATYVMFIGLEKVLELGVPDAVKVYSEQMLDLHRGQGMDIYWRDNFQCPSEEEYRQMTIRKTGGLFNLAVRLLQLFAPTDANNRDFSELTSLLGLYFQIRDDYCNLQSEEYATNKSFAEDLTEGKFNFPIIHAIRTNPEDTKVLSILRRRTTDIELKKYCISLLKKAGSFDYTVGVLLDLEEKIKNEIQSIGGNDGLIALMDELSNWQITAATRDKFSKVES